LARAVGDAHQRYTRMINKRKNWQGYLWQGRFSSYPMDEFHTVACARCIELNPVKAGLVKRPEDWPWSSARSHLRKRKDAFCTSDRLLSMAGDWRELLESGGADGDRLLRHQRTGRPLGDEAFIERCERDTGRKLKKKKPGPRKRTGN